MGFVMLLVRGNSRALRLPAPSRPTTAGTRSPAQHLPGTEPSPGPRGTAWLAPLGDLHLVSLLPSVKLSKVGTLFPSWRTAFMASPALLHPAGREVARTGLSLPCALTAAWCQCPRLVPALCSAPPARTFPMPFNEVQGSFSLCGNSQSRSWLPEGPA